MGRECRGATTQQIYRTGKSNRTTCRGLISSCIQINIRTSHRDVTAGDFNDTQINLGRIGNGKAGQVICCCAVDGVCCITDITDHVYCGRAAVESQGIPGGINRTNRLPKSDAAGGAGNSPHTTDQDSVIDINNICGDIGVEQGGGAGAEDIKIGGSNTDVAVDGDIRTGGVCPQIEGIGAQAGQAAGVIDDDIACLPGIADIDIHGPIDSSEFPFAEVQGSCRTIADPDGRACRFTPEGDGGRPAATC